MKRTRLYLSLIPKYEGSITITQYQDAKYLRLKNAQIGYTFPQPWMKKLYVKNLRIFASVQNPLTFTKMKGGWDPEYTGDGSGRAYPVARVYSFGLNVKF